MKFLKMKIKLLAWNTHDRGGREECASGAWLNGLAFRSFCLRASSHAM